MSPEGIYGIPLALRGISFLVDNNSENNDISIDIRKSGTFRYNG